LATLNGGVVNGRVINSGRGNFSIRVVPGFGIAGLADLEFSDALDLFGRFVFWKAKHDEVVKKHAKKTNDR
jgi:hypothetical protein